jgi:exosortase
MALKFAKRVWIPLLVLAGCLAWALWPVLVDMRARWEGDPRYAHGYLVPLFALWWLVWPLRPRLLRPKLAGKEGGIVDLPDREAAPKPDLGPKFAGSVWGVALVGFGACVHLVGGYYRIGWIEGIALLPYLAGLAVLFGGWPALEWAWPAIAFLAFMIPLPWRVEHALGPPLQSIATTASTYLLQTLGFMAFAEGNVIQLNEARIGVVEACSGLSMLITFIALSTAAAMVVKRPLLDRIVLVMSSIPVALVANIIRITVTGILHNLVGGHAADRFYHDLAGWLMIPLALILYWLEIWVLTRLLPIEIQREGPVVVGLGRKNRPASKNSNLSKGYLPSTP